MSKNKLLKRVCAFKTSAIEKDGSFSGHASVFGNVDSYRDVVMPGAFGKTLAQWKAKGTLPPLLWQHQSDKPIGPHTSMSEDGDGLMVEGQLLIDDVQQAKEAYALVKAGVIRGMSIGYDLFPDGCDYDAENSIMKLTGIDLWENSIVTFPANDQAMVSEVKEMLRSGNMPTLREFEKALRELGFSKRLTTQIAMGGYANLLRSESGSGATKEGGETLPSVEDVCAAISGFELQL